MTVTNPPVTRSKTLADWRARIEAPLADAWKWWTGELAACVPPRLRQRFAAPRGRVLLILDAAGDNLIQETANGRRPLGRIDLDAPAERSILAAVPRGRPDERLPVVIRLDAHHALRTTASLPLAAERNLAQVVGFEFERLMPFQKSEVYYAYRITARDKTALTLTIELTVVPRAEIAKAIAALDHLGLQPTELQVTSAKAAAPTAIALTTAGERGRSSSRMVAVLGAGAAVLAIACLAIPLWQADKAIAALNAQIADARREAELSANIEKQIESANHDQQFLIDRKRARPSATELLATLTQLLPDDTYLTELDIKGNDIRLVGIAPSATAVLALIDKSPSFRDASFESSITQDAKTNRERFDIGAHIAPRGSP
jgi:general secretion pathway protein L